jgi:ketosteroid isomerase-like protein
MGVSNRSFAAAAALLVVSALAPTLAAPPQRDAERGVRRTLIRLNDLLGRRDMAILDEFTDGEDTLLVGSLPSDRARGRHELEAHFRAYFERPETLSFVWREVDVAVRGAVAWLHAEGEVVIRGDEGVRREPYRLTGVLELHGGKWLWRLFHGSQPA